MDDGKNLTTVCADRISLVPSLSTASFFFSLHIKKLAEETAIGRMSFKNKHV